MPSFALRFGTRLPVRTGAPGDKEDGQGVNSGRVQCFLPGALRGARTVAEDYGYLLVFTFLIGECGAGGDAELGGHGGGSVACAQGLCEQLFQRQALDKERDKIAGEGADGVFREQVEDHPGEGCLLPRDRVAIDGKPARFGVDTHALLNHVAFEHGGVEGQQLLVGDEWETVFDAGRLLFAFGLH